MIKTLKIAIVVLLGAIFIVKVYVSLDWRMELDTPILHYVAFLMDKHDVMPYRDVFETSMPGTFIFHYLLGKIAGYSDAAVRYADVTLLMVLLVITFGFMRRFGVVVASGSMFLFGLLYLSHGPIMSLQRDYLAMFPVAISLLLIPIEPQRVVKLWRFALLGCCFGVAAMFKPHIIIALPLLFFILSRFQDTDQAGHRSALLAKALVTMLSFLIPVSIALLWLYLNSALAPFWDMVVNYLPRHTSITGYQQVLPYDKRLLYLIVSTLRLHDYGALFMCALFVYYRASLTGNERGPLNYSLVALAACAIAYAIYPALAGKFWGYHYIPFIYFISLSASLCLDDSGTEIRPRSSKLLADVLPLLIFAVALSVQLWPHQMFDTLIHGPQQSPATICWDVDRVDAIAEYLTEHLEEGETVQPLDWTGGSIQAMLYAKAKLATTYLYDYHFYHSVSDTYTQNLRRDFIRQLKSAAPRFIVEILTNKPWVSGMNTSRKFQALDDFKKANYFVAFECADYIIYEHSGD